MLLAGQGAGRDKFQELDDLRRTPSTCTLPGSTRQDRLVKFISSKAGPAEEAWRSEQISVLAFTC